MCPELLPRDNSWDSARFFDGVPVCMRVLDLVVVDGVARVSVADDGAEAVEYALVASPFLASKAPIPTMQASERRSVRI
jgi:hypothetical protein